MEKSVPSGIPRASIKREFPDVGVVHVLVPHAQLQRLASKAFRGRHIRKAGNLSAWETARALLGDPDITSQLFPIVLEAIREHSGQGSQTESYTIEMEYTIGWAGTIPLDEVDPDCLVPFKLNKRARGLRVDIDHPNAPLAPRTDELTLICMIRPARQKWLVLIQSLYPGPDVGELRGDVSKREGVAFLGWDCPGGSL